MMTPSAQIVLMMTVLALVIAAAVVDWRSRRIPNLLTLGGMLVGFALQATFNGLDGVQAALGGCAVGFALMIPGYALGQTGAGDVKLLATAGVFLGPATTLVAGLSSILVGALVALLIALFGRGANPWARYGNMLRCLLVTGKAAYVPPQAGEVMARSFPYGLAIAAGTLFALYWSLI
jgi:prepilin peptidase CpaA